MACMYVIGLAIGAMAQRMLDENVKAADLPPLSTETMSKVQTIYDRLIRPKVHAHY